MAEPLRTQSEPMQPVKLVGKYALYQKIAAGGMATVHLGRLLGPAGFARTIAVKRLHAPYAKDPKFVEMFLDEARIAGRIRHPNVVAMLDVVPTEGELFLIMDYVHGEALSTILRALAAKRQSMSVPMAASVIIGALEGLHAAHELRDEEGRHLGVVHRDMSPQNILLGADGVARVVDFGVAKAADNAQTSTVGMVKGKLAYMSPEQAYGHEVTRLTDVYAMGLVTWELLTGQRLRPKGTDLSATLRRMHDAAPVLSQVVDGIPAALDAAVTCALDPNPEKRFPTALEFAKAISHAVRSPASWEVGHWVRSVVGDSLRPREQLVSQMERASCSFAATFVPDDWADSGLSVNSLMRLRTPDSSPSKPSSPPSACRGPVSIFTPGSSSEPPSVAVAERVEQVDEIPVAPISNVVATRRSPVANLRSSSRPAPRIPSPADLASSYEPAISQPSVSSRHSSVPPPLRRIPSSKPPVPSVPVASIAPAPLPVSPLTMPLVAPGPLSATAFSPAAAFARTLIAPSSLVPALGEHFSPLERHFAEPIAEVVGPALEPLSPRFKATAADRRFSSPFGPVPRPIRSPRRLPWVLAVTTATLLGILLFAHLVIVFTESHSVSKVVGAGQNVPAKEVSITPPESAVAENPAAVSSTSQEPAAIVNSRPEKTEKKAGRRVRFYAR